MFLSLACESVEKEGVMRKFWTILSGALIIVFLAGAGEQGPKVQTTSAQTSSIPGSAALKVDQDFGKMPLYFIPNQGQMDAQVAYYLQGKDKTIYFTSEGLTYLLSERRAGEEIAEKTASVKEHLVINPAERELRSRRDQRRFAVKLDFVGANADVRPSGEEKTGAVISYFKGKPEEWKAGLPTYSRIVYKDLWPGIDVAYYGTVDKMKYEFVVHPGSDPSLIRLAYRGASAVEVNGEGRLEVRTPAGGFEDDRPVGYQEINGDRVDVAISYLLEEQPVIKPRPNGQEAVTKSYVYGFVVGAYDRTKLLILDPAVLVYCGYIGGSDADQGDCIEVDNEGNTYIAGSTRSTEATFPVISGHLDQTFNGDRDAFVAKVNALGNALVYCMYVGGSSTESPKDIAIDGEGNVYIAGYTLSDQMTFPAIFFADVTFNGNMDAFIAKFNSSGTELFYCGYIGGAGNDCANGIAVDTHGDAYITGWTASISDTFPVLGGPDLIQNGDLDAFVAKVNSTTKALEYCGYIGGSGADEGLGIAVYSLGTFHTAYITGYTESTEDTFPVSGGGDLTHNGGFDAFIAVFGTPAVDTGFSCGYIGGSGDDVGYDIALNMEKVGSFELPFVYVTGSTNSTQATFPVVNGPDLTHNGGYDAFIAKYRGWSPIYCGYIGGGGYEEGLGIEVDYLSKAAYVTGRTYSTEASFPVVGGPDLTYNGDSDAFVAKVNASGTALVYCGYIGGLDWDGAYDIAVDRSGNAYVTGEIHSTQATFPVIRGPDLTYNGGADDAFVAKISWIQEDDFLATWDGQGVYCRNSMNGDWALMASPATLITAGDLDGDRVDDLIGIWPAQGGVYVKYSKTGKWSPLSSAARDIAAGDMNGDGRVDLLGTWDGQGVFYRNSKNGAWVKMASPATLIAAGDLDDDGTDDLLGIWPAQGGVWAKYSETGAWAYLCSIANDIAAGDMNGDGSADLLVTWDGEGVYYRNFLRSGDWVRMSTPADMITAGDIDGDGVDDLIGIWPAQGGAYVKYAATGSWAKLSSSARDIAAGKMRAGTGGSMPAQALFGPMGGYAQGPESLIQYQDISSEGPGGLHFVYQTEEQLIPQEQESEMMRIPGPGEPGFRCVEEKNLIPEESRESDATKKDRERNTK